MRSSRSQGELLYGFIKRLSAREKAHFKRLHSANKSGSKQLVLFDFLNRLKQYDRAAISTFAKEHNIRLNSANVGLQEGLVRSLRIYHSTTTVSLELNDLLSEIEILYLKGLHEISGKLIEKGMALADSNERTTYSLLFRFWRLRHQFIMEDHREVPEAIESQIEEIEFLAGELGITLSTHYLAHLIDFTFEDTTMPFHEGKAIIENKILKHPIVARDKPPSLSAGKYAYNDLIASGHFYLENWDACLEYTLNLYKILTQSGDGDGQTFSPYRIGMVLGNLMAISNFMGQQDAFRKFHDQFEALTADLQDEKEARLIREICIPRVNLQRMIHCMAIGAFDKGERLVIEDLFPFAESDSREEVKIRVLSEIARFYLAFDHYESTLGLCTELHGIKALRQDRELFYAVSWMEILACYGMRDESLLSSRVRSFSNYLRDGNGRDWELERTMLSTLHKNLFATRKERSAAMAALYEQLNQKRAIIRKPTRHFDLLAWFEKEAG